MVTAGVKETCSFKSITKHCNYHVETDSLSLTSLLENAIRQKKKAETKLENVFSQKFESNSKLCHDVPQILQCPASETVQQETFSQCVCKNN